MVSIEGNNIPPPHVSVGAFQKGGIGHSGGRVASDGIFTIAGVGEGEVSLSVMLQPPNRFYVKSIQWNGLDLLHDKLMVQDGTEIKDVRIVISPKDD